MVPGVRRRLVVGSLLLALSVVVVDQATKAWALATLTEGERTPVLGDLLGLSLVRNPGAALSLATGATWVFTVAAVVVSVAIVRISGRLGSRGWAVGLGLLLGGAVGNLVDRLAREPGVGRGHVVDFLAYGSWFVGNVADIAIVLAAVLVVVLTLRGIGVDGRRTAEKAPGDGGRGSARDEHDDPGHDDPAAVARSQTPADPA